MNKILKPIIVLLLLGCSQHNGKMNSLLKSKKNLEIIIDSTNEKEARFKSITGYSEMDDSLALNTTYPHPELVDSIYYLKEQREYSNNEREKVKYSIDSLQKLR